MSLLNKPALSTITFLVWSLFAAAQNCSITVHGSVLDEHDGSPMENVSVFITELAMDLWTDAEGEFEAVGLCPGTYHLIIQHIGCPVERKIAQIVVDTILLFSLEHHENMLHEVDVHDHHEHDINEERISLLQLDENPQSTLAETVAHIAGVSIISNGSDIGLPVLHGLSGSRITLINNGVVHTGQQWGNDHSPEIDLNGADEITVVSGAGAMRYPGTHMGGLVIIEPSKIPLDPHIHGKVRTAIESNGLGGTLNARLYQGNNELQWRIGATIKRYGDRSAPSYSLNNTGTVQAHANAEIHKQWDSGVNWEGHYNVFSSIYGILRGSHIGNLTDLQEAFIRDVPFYTDPDFSYTIEAPRQSVQHHQLKSTFKKSWDDHNLEWSMAAQRNQRREFDVRRSGRSDIPALSLLQYSIQSDVICERGEELEAGYQFLGKNNWNLPETGILPLLPNYTAFTNGFFITQTIYMEHLELDLGGRYDFTYRNVAMISNSLPREVLYFKEQYHNLSALVQTKYPLSSKWKAMAEIALRQRPPEVNEVYAFGLHQGVSGIEEGNLELGKESSLKASAQLRGKVGDRLHVDIRGYAHLFKGYIYLQPRDEFRLTIRGAFPVFSYEQCDARLLGGDFVMSYELNRFWKIKSNWAFLRGWNTTDDLPLNYMPPLNARNLITRELAHWGNWQNLKIELSHHYVAEQTNWDSSLDFIAPPAAYNLFDVYFSGTLKKGKYKPQLRLGVENVLNTSYRDYLNRQRYFADALGRNITLGWLQNF